jgi:hypothetical protein
MFTQTVLCKHDALRPHEILARIVLIHEQKEARDEPSTV